MRQIFGDILAAFWLPSLAGSAMAIGTWLVWFYSGAPVSVMGGGPDAAAVMCRAGPLAPYLNLEILHYCYVHATIAITLTGGSDIMMFIRESRRNQRAEKAAEERNQRAEKAAEERYERERQEAQERYERERQEAQERYERDQEHTARLFAMVQNTVAQAQEERRAAEEERRAAEERHRQDLLRAEARADARAEADRQAFINTINQLSAAIARNGNGGGNGDDSRRQTGY